MFRTSFRVAALTVALNLSACAPPEQLPPEDDQSYVAPTAISQELGPEGGELIAPDDSPLAGVKLRVPAGALSTKVTLTIDLRNEAKSLQGDAERVGPQFVVGPADVTFAAPVELTVPIDDRELSKHAQTHDDCKVWFRTDGEWSRLERKTSAEGSITVDMPAPGVAAAGVLAKTSLSICTAKPQLCLTGVTPFIPAAQRCTSPTGYCIVKLPTPRYEPMETQPNFTIVGRKLYYAHAPANDQMSVVRYDIDTGDSVLLGTRATNRHPYNTPIAVEADGSAWLALGDPGNVKFKENTLPLRFDFEIPSDRSREGRGVIVTGGKTFRFLELNREDVMIEGTTTKPIPANFPVSGRTYSYLPRPAVSGGMLAFNIIDFFSLEFTNPAATEVFEANSYQDGAASFRNAGIATLIHHPDEIRWKTASNGEQRISIPPEQTLLAFDGNDLVYVASTRTPELSIATDQGGLGTLPLTTAASGTPEYRSMVPRALVGVPGRGEVLLQVAGTSSPRQREFYIVRSSN